MNASFLAGRGYLLDLGVALALVALLGLTALTSVAPAAQTIQGDGDGLVGLAAPVSYTHLVTMEYSDTVEKGKIIRQTPEAGEVIEKGSTIDQMCIRDSARPPAARAASWRQRWAGRGCW